MVWDLPNTFYFAFIEMIMSVLLIDGMHYIS